LVFREQQIFQIIPYQHLFYGFKITGLQFVEIYPGGSVLTRLSRSIPNNFMIAGFHIDGILIVEFANQRRAGGLSIKEAVIDAAVQRFRPILMTSLATVFGVLPIALALGAAAKSRASMGIVIIGGLLFSLGLTLFVIPALYTYLSSRKQRTVSRPMELAGQNALPS